MRKIKKLQNEPSVEIVENVSAEDNLVSQNKNPSRIQGKDLDNPSMTQGMDPNETNSRINTIKNPSKTQGNFFFWFDNSSKIKGRDPNEAYLSLHLSKIQSMDPVESLIFQRRDLVEINELCVNPINFFFSNFAKDHLK